MHAGRREEGREGRREGGRERGREGINLELFEVKAPFHHVHHIHTLTEHRQQLQCQNGLMRSLEHLRRTVRSRGGGGGGGGSEEGKEEYCTLSWPCSPDLFIPQRKLLLCLWSVVVQ